MLIVRLKTWLPIEGIEHIATTWEVSSTRTFDNITSSERSETMLDVYYSDIVVPVGDTYYVRAKRHFNDPTADYWTEVVEVLNNEAEYSAMLLSEDVTVDIPLLYINRDEIISNTETFDIRTTSFRGNLEDHYCTHWIIKDGIGSVIYTSLYDTVNKTKITINKNIGINNKTKIIITAIHCTASGIESKPIEQSINISLFNYEIVSDLTKVTPLRDYILKFRKITEALTLRIVKVEMLDSDQKTLLFTRNLAENELELTIPWTVFRPNANFYFRIYAYDINSNFSSAIKLITTQTNKSNDIIDPNYVYENIFIKNDVSQPLAVLGNYITTYELLSGKLPIVTTGSNLVQLAEFDHIANNIVNLNGHLEGVSLLTNNVDQTYIKYLSNNLLLIDTLNAVNLPTFLVYKHDVYSDTYTLLHSSTRNDETHSLGFTNAILQINDSEFIYVAYNTNKIKKYSLIGNNVEIIGEIPNSLAYKGTFIPMGKNQILLYGGEVFDASVFNYKDNLFEKSTSIVPDSFLNRPLKAARLINGDTIVFKTTYVNTDLDTNIMYFDYKNSVFKETEYVFPPGEAPTSVYSSIEGSVMLVDYNVDTSYGKTPNTITIYTAE